MQRQMFRTAGLISPLMLVLAFPPTAGAADLSGYVSGTTKVAQELPLAGERVARRVRFKLAIVTDDKASPFNLASQDCMVTYVFTKDGKPLDGHGYCDGITATGDIWWISVTAGADGIVHWTNLAGTGALENFAASGSSRTLAQFEDGKVIIRFEGTASKKM